MMAVIVEQNQWSLTEGAAKILEEDGKIRKCSCVPPCSKVRKIGGRIMGDIPVYHLKGEPHFRYSPEARYGDVWTIIDEAEREVASLKIRAKIKLPLALGDVMSREEALSLVGQKMPVTDTQYEGIGEGEIVAVYWHAANNVIVEIEVTIPNEYIGRE